MTRRQPELEMLSAEEISQLSDAGRELLVRLLADAGPQPEMRIPRRETSVGAPLSPTQRRLWFLNELGIAKSAQNMCCGLEMTGPLDVRALEGALNVVVARHEALRTNVVAEEGLATQRISPPRCIGLRLVDLSMLDAKARNPSLEGLELADATRPFDLAAHQLLRCMVVRLAAHRHLLLLSVHHIACDRWSIAILGDELQNAYAAELDGRDPELPALEIQYADFAVWQLERLEGGAFAAELDYWRARLAHAPATSEFPPDQIRPTLPHRGRGAVSRRIPVDVPGRVDGGEATGGGGLFVRVLAAFALLLGRYAGQDDVVIGTAVSGRSRQELEALIGCFVNTVALRLDVSARQTAEGYLQAVKREVVKALDCASVPFERIVDELRLARSLNRNPLFQTMVVARDEVPVPRLPGLTISNLSRRPDSTFVDVTLIVERSEGEIVLDLEYDADLFDEETVALLLDQTVTLMEALATRGGRRLDDLLVDENQREAVPYPASSLRAEVPVRLENLFEEMAEETPDVAAIIASDGEWTYAGLAHGADQIARGLTDRGAGPGERVALSLEGGAAVEAMLGVLAAGSAFVYVDRTLPPVRLQSILEDVSPLLWIRGDDVAAELGPLEGDRGIVCLESRELKTTHAPAREPFSDRDAAFVVYTSGSTGRPKGIVQSHRSFVQFLRWQNRYLGLGPSSRIAQWSSLGFDASYCEILGAICSGATLCMVPKELRLDPAALLEWMEAHDLDVFQTVPSFFAHLLRAARQSPAGARALADLRHLLLSGEALPPQLVRAWFEDISSKGRLVNFYGPTECVLATHYEVERVRERERAIPIGEAIPGREILVLGPGGQPRAPGMVGEIYVRSAFLSDGYFRRPEETRRFFIQNPVHQAYADPAYRTGDLGRVDARGRLHFCGRSDHQTKVRGVRVELGEIEIALARHPAIRECAALTDAAGEETRILAYIVSDDELDDVELRRFLRNTLPDPMVPSRFVAVEAIPRTSSGKPDRSRLSLPEACPGLRRAIARPESPLEVEIARIWSQRLGVDEVSVDDNFFEIGGNSLELVQVRDSLHRTLGMRLPLAEMFLHPTIASLASHVSAGRAPSSRARDDGALRGRRRRAALARSLRGAMHSQSGAEEG